MSHLIEAAMLSSTYQSCPDAEEALIRNASMADLETFNQLVLAYQNMAYNQAYALLGDPALSDDATQESFIKAFQNLPSFRGGSFRAWLLKIVTNSAYDILRQSKQHQTQPLLPEDEDGEEVESSAWLADPAVSVQAIVEQNEFAERLYQMLDELPSAYRGVLTLVDSYQFDYTEAASILKVPIGTIKSRLARARLQMQQKLRNSAEYSGDFSPAGIRAYS
jgi:RNA polymerase sigma-70 factor (ECF subfamily)